MAETETKGNAMVVATLPTLVLVAVLVALAAAAAEALSPPSMPILAASPPVLGIGALLFRPRNVRFVKSGDYDNNEGGGEDALALAGRFFVDAFWTGKVGGASKLSQSQSNSLERQQIMEFKRRYKSSPQTSQPTGRLPGRMASMSSSRMDKRAELVLCVDGRGECIGCAGVEVDKIKKMDGYDSTITAPLMSNLAISKKYRRKGLAEDLVKATETIARREWGYDDCYLYVEKRNAPAIKLYKKLGYRTIWEDDTATTLLPTEDGRVVNGKTTIVCMKKGLGGGLFGNLFGI